MAAIDKKDRNFYNRLNDDQRKAFSAWMMMRYCSSVQGRDAPNYIYLTNELVNFPIYGSKQTSRIAMAIT